MIFLLGIVLVCLSIIFPLGKVWSQLTDIPIVSTRNHYDVSNGENIHSNISPYNIIDNTNKISSCPAEIVIYVHGIWVGNQSLENPYEVFDRLSLALINNGYLFPLVGYSWDSDTDVSPEGWNIAKHIAANNGKNLANFIYSYKQQCSNSDVRIIAHSLGARVVLESLNYLDRNILWKNNGFKISSVDLLGAAVDNEEISMNQNDGNDDNLSHILFFYDPSVKSTYGNAIKNQVMIFHNWYNPEDDVLEPDTECRLLFCQNVYYPFYEGDLALGQNGYQSGITLPNNYNQTNVQDEIYFDKDANGNGQCDLFIPFTVYCTIQRTGDNHFGYIGFRDPNNQNNLLYRNNLLYDGAIDAVVENWRTSM